MSKFFLKTLFLTMLTFAYSNAAVVKDDDYFNAICIENDSIGFNWKNSDWKKVNFTTSRYIVKKLKIEKIIPGKGGYIPDSGGCSNQIYGDGIIMSDDTYKYNEACYNVREEGTDLAPFASKKCYERWVKVDGKFKLTMVDCEDFKFAPNGWFHKSSIHINITNKPKNDYKDSLSLSYGKCSVL